MKKKQKCTVCGKKFDLYDKYADLCFVKQIGYGSIYDGETLNLCLCCECFDGLASKLEEKSCKSIFKK